MFSCCAVLIHFAGFVLDQIIKSNINTNSDTVRIHLFLSRCRDLELYAFPSYLYENQIDHTKYKHFNRFKSYFLMVNMRFNFSVCYCRLLYDPVRYNFGLKKLLRNILPWYFHSKCTYTRRYSTIFGKISVVNTIRLQYLWLRYPNVRVH